MSEINLRVYTEHWPSVAQELQALQERMAAEGKPFEFTRELIVTEEAVDRVTETFRKRRRARRRQTGLTSG